MVVFLRFLGPSIRGCGGLEGARRLSELLSEVSGRGGAGGEGLFESDSSKAGDGTVDGEEGRERRMTEADDGWKRKESVQVSTQRQRRRQLR